MFQQAPTIAMAFLGGVISFVTPCVLPLVPGYISFISGVSLTELQSGESKGFTKALVLAGTGMFILGFSLVFIASGMTAFAFGQVIAEYKEWLIRAAGAVIIVLGLHMTGIFRIGALDREARYHGGKGGTLPRALVLGMAFAFGWSPCLGPILGGIYGLAMNQDKAMHALGLLVAYCLGLAIPFLITGLTVDYFFRVFDRVKQHFHKIEIGAGILLVELGNLMLLDRFDYLKILFDFFLPDAVNLWG